MVHAWLKVSSKYSNASNAVTHKVLSVSFFLQKHEPCTVGGLTLASEGARSGFL